MATTREKTILDKIVDARRESDRRTASACCPDVALKIAVQKAEPPRDFAGALTRNDLQHDCRAEKGVSFARGDCARTTVRRFLRRQLESAGAAALSVLTEEEFFLGSLAHLKEVKKVTAHSHPAQGLHRRPLAGVGSARGRRRYFSADCRGSR